MNNTPNNAKLAARRVDETPALQPYRYILLEYEWDNQDDHLSWVVTASTEELLSWCKTVDAGETA